MLKRYRPLCIFLSKMSAYRRDFGKTKYMFFSTNSFDKFFELLKKYNKICKTFNTIDKEFDSNPVYNKKQSNI